jgi:hypothetical protein
VQEKDKRPAFFRFGVVTFGQKEQVVHFDCLRFFWFEMGSEFFLDGGRGGHRFGRGTGGEEEEEK